MPTAVRFCPLSTTRWVSPGARSSPSRGWPGWAPCWPPSELQIGEARAQSAGYAEGDLKILNVALGLEHEAIAAYQAGAESKLLDKPVLDVAVLFQSQHKAHRDALAATIKRAGGTPVEPKKMSEYTWPRLASQTDVLMFAAKLEAGAASAYLGALRAIENKEYLTAAASIMGNETQHLALLRQVLKENPVPAPFIG